MAPCGSGHTRIDLGAHPAACRCRGAAGPRAHLPAGRQYGRVGGPRVSRACPAACRDPPTRSAFSDWRSSSELLASAPTASSSSGRPCSSPRSTSSGSSTLARFLPADRSSVPPGAAHPAPDRPRLSGGRSGRGARAPRSGYPAHPGVDEVLDRARPRRDHASRRQRTGDGARTRSAQRSLLLIFHAALAATKSNGD